MKMNTKHPAFPLSEFLIYVLLFTFILPAPFLPVPQVFANEKIKILVNDLKSTGVDELIVETLTSLIKDTVNKTGKYTVVTREKGVDRVIVGSIEKEGDTYTIKLRLLDGEKARTMNTHVEKITEALPDRVEMATSILLFEASPNLLNAGKVDQAGPVIRHIPLTSKNGKEKIAISATVQDQGRIRNVILHYRASGQEAFSLATMKEESNGRYEGLIPESEVTENGMEYYLEAFDETGNRTTEGTLSQPHFISVEISKAPKKKSSWWKWTLGAVVLGGAVAALAGGGGGSGGGGATDGGVSVTW